MTQAGQSPPTWTRAVRHDVITRGAGGGRHRPPARRGEEPQIQMRFPGELGHVAWPDPSAPV